jgi:hypothetical protein
MLWKLLGSCGRDFNTKSNKTLYQLRLEMEDAKKALDWALDGGPNSNNTRTLMWDLMDANDAYQKALAESKTLRSQVSTYFSTLWVRILMLIPRK